MRAHQVEDVCEPDCLLRGADDQLRRLAVVDLMNPSIAHDVNNMLKSVGRVLRMQDRRIARGSPEELATLAADGLQAVSPAEALSKRLLTFGRPAASVQSRVDVNAILRDLEPLLGWALGFDVALDLALAHSALETWCDPQDLENAILNLATNACDASPDGGCFALRIFKANLSLYLPGLLSGDYVMIAASDTGQGMTPEVMARAIDPLFTTKGAGAGFGMGLASVKAFVEAAGGLTDITSYPAEGTTVRLYLPLARPRTPRRQRLPISAVRTPASPVR